MTIELQQYVEGVWTAIDTTSTLADGAFSLSITILTLGHYLFRAGFKGTAEFRESYSSKVTVDVVEEAPPPSPPPKPGRWILRAMAARAKVPLGEEIEVYGTFSFISVIRTVPVPFVLVTALQDGVPVATGRTSLTGSYSLRWIATSVGTFTIVTEAWILPKLLGKPVAESNVVSVTVEG